MRSISSATTRGRDEANRCRGKRVRQWQEQGHDDSKHTTIKFGVVANAYDNDGSRDDANVYVHAYGNDESKHSTIKW